MTLPDKPVTVDLDAIGLDQWIVFTDVAAQLEGLRGTRNMTTISEALRSARELLVAILIPGGWTEAEVGALNIGELKQVIGLIGQGIRGPNAPSGLPSKPPSNTAGRSPSKPASAGPRKNGAAPRGKLHPSSA